jgi:hypothetical protein
MIWLTLVVALVWGGPLVFDLYRTKKPRSAVSTESLKTK